MHLSQSFNPRLPGGRRPPNAIISADRRCFNPRLPGGRRPARRYGYCVGCKGFQSTPSGGRRLLPVRPDAVEIEVSIHAFRGEGDSQHPLLSQHIICFNPRLPGGRRPGGFLMNSLGRSFNPRLPGGRRPASPDEPSPLGRVSIHAFRGEGDAASRFVAASIARFQSTPSGGKATHPLTGRIHPHLFQSTPSGGKAT